MAAKAGEITAERLSERLPVENPDDGSWHYVQQDLTILGR